jgi:vitamin B12 transporter
VIRNASMPVIALAMTALAGVPLFGQVRPIPLDTVQVQVNSRASASLGATTRAVEVIDASEIRAIPALTVNDVLQWAFGVEMMPRSAALADVAIRGSSFEQVLILVDGVRVRDAQTGHFNLNLAIPLDQIERIEILRGPAASLYGSDAMAGVINILTRTSGEITSVRISRGTFATTAASLSHRRLIGSVAADVAASYQQSDGHRFGTDYEIGTGRIGLSVPLGAERLHADFAYAEREFGADNFYGPYPSFETVRTTTASVRWRAAPDSIFSLEPRVSFRRNSDDFLLDRDQPGGSRNAHTSDQVGGELIGRLAVSEQVRIAAGLHGYRDRIESTALGDRDEWTSAGSVEAALGSLNAVSATLGVRADRLVTGSVVTSPSLSVAWRPTPALRVRSSVGRSFRSPTWTERYYPQVGGNVGNPDLEPEEAWSTDAGIEVYPIPALRLSGSLFLRKATDLIDWARPAGDPQSVWMTRNVESADFSGVEVELELPDLMEFRILARGAWTSLSTSAAAGFDSKYALRPQVDHLALSIDRTFLDRFSLGLRGAHERRLGEASYMRVDARAALDLTGVRLWMDVSNAADEEYRDVVGNPAPGRSLSLGLEWRAGG